MILKSRILEATNLELKEILWSAQTEASFRVAEESGIARQALYKMRYREGNPSFKNVNKLLEAVGLKLTVK